MLHAPQAGAYVLTSDFDVIPDDQQPGGTCPQPGD
jgi:hypothetical protein